MAVTQKTSVEEFRLHCHPIVHNMPVTTLINGLKNLGKTNRVFRILPKRLDYKSTMRDVVEASQHLID